jgi:hypothetical protein
MCEPFDFDALMYECTANQIKYEIEEEKFLQNRLTIKEFLNWFKGEGKVYSSVWLNRIDNELKAKISLNELNKNTLIHAWELHDSQPKNQERKILWRSFAKTIMQNRFKMYDYRTALEYIALSKRAAVRYKLPFFDTSLRKKKETKLDREGISTKYSIRTVRKR